MNQEKIEDLDIRIQKLAEREDYEISLQSPDLNTALHGIAQLIEGIGITSKLGTQRVLSQLAVICYADKK